MDIGNIIKWAAESKENLLILWTAAGVFYLAFHKLLVTVRDIIDKTPGEDTNLFEKIVTFMGKLTKYFISGERPK